MWTVLYHRRKASAEMARTCYTYVLPKQLLYSELTACQRAPGGPKKGLKDNIKANLKKFRIDSTNWEAFARPRAAWRVELHEGATLQEHNLRRAAAVKRQQRKERETTRAVK